MFDEDDMTVIKDGVKYPVVSVEWRGRSYNPEDAPIREMDESGETYGLIFQVGDKFQGAYVNTPEVN